MNEPLQLLLNLYALKFFIRITMHQDTFLKETLVTVTGITGAEITRRWSVLQEFIEVHPKYLHFTLKDSCRQEVENWNIFLSSQEKESSSSVNEEDNKFLTILT